MHGHRQTGGVCCAECAASGGSCSKGMGAATSTYERFDLSKYESIYNPPPVPSAIDPQWNVLNAIMGGKAIVPGSPAERMYPQTLEAQRQRAEEAAKRTGSLVTWVLIGGATVLGVTLIAGGRR